MYWRINTVLISSHKSCFYSHKEEAALHGQHSAEENERFLPGQQRPGQKIKGAAPGACFQNLWKNPLEHLRRP